MGLARTALFVRRSVGGLFAVEDMGKSTGSRVFVHSGTGTDAGGYGAGPDKPVATIDYAIGLCTANKGDIIYVMPGHAETAVATADVAGISIIGVGTGPQQATWTGANDSVCLTISANAVLVKNIKFTPPAYTASRATSAITLSGANYARIHNCRFQGKTGSQAAIYSPVCDSDNVEIADCEFQYMNTATYGAGILGVEAGGLSYSGWRILRNMFASCVTAININGRVCLVEGNTILEYGITAAGAVDAVLALGIDLSGTSSGGNAVWRNQLGGTYNATLYKVGASGDQWAGNLSVISGGTTAANPA
jgi:hypothetical protein